MHVLPIHIMCVFGVIRVLLFDVLSIIEAESFEVTLLVLIFKGLFLLAKFVYD